MPNDPRPRRRSLRLPGYDYSQAGAYFITACTQNRFMLFGGVIDGEVQLNEMGTIVQQTWDDLPTHYNGIDLDAFIVMPNHVHGIIILADESERRHAIPEIVRGFKTFSARRINERAGRRGVLWQRGFTGTSFAMRKRSMAFAFTSRIILRGGRMTQRTSRERCLAKQGGFETRPYDVS